MKTIDCRGQQCPQPVIQTRKVMLEDPGTTLKVLVDDKVCQDNVSRLATSLGYTIALETSSDAITLELTPGERPVTEQQQGKTGPTIIVRSPRMLAQPLTASSSDRQIAPLKPGPI